MTKRNRWMVVLAALAWCIPTAAAAQVMEGEVRVVVRDPDGLPLQAEVAIAGRNP